HFADGLDDPEKVKEKFHENPPNVYGYGHDPLYKDVMDAIKNDRKPYIDAVEGRKALELVLAIYKSSIDGNKVKLPLDGVSSIDFKGMFNK
ncbi:MAG: gfo/Idh/MocA family oxidoreductase, partial [Tissierellia bacterium]|nr:gfo/Idh/MocA family oxidoreductase [Tissierellia bacterium]